jgi:hypothetical protein
MSILSLKIQSLPAKFEALKELITELTQNKCQPDIICLQEIWTVLDAKFFPSDGYQSLIFKSRLYSQGGGIGNYQRWACATFFSVRNRNSATGRKHFRNRNSATFKEMLLRNRNSAIPQS